MKKLHILCCVTADKRFAWEVWTLLENLRQIKASKKAIILVFSWKSQTPDPLFEKIEEIFSEVKFIYYKDEDYVVDDARGCGYEALFRPYILSKFFEEHKELQKDAFLYIDSDVLFTRPLKWINELLSDDVNYLSYAGARGEKGGNYLNCDYFDSKIKDVLPEMVEEYKQIDVLSDLVKGFNLTRKMCEDRKEECGGAQYILKDMNGAFWGEVYAGSMYIRNYLMRKINSHYFENEDKGFQSWCADMWAILFALWRRGSETKCPESMDFSWATDRIEKVRKLNIFHNAGITKSESLRDNQRGEDGKKIEIDCPAFFKGHYRRSPITPFEDIEYVKLVSENPISRRFGTSYYTDYLLMVKDKYKL